MNPPSPLRRKYRIKTEVLLPNVTKWFDSYTLFFIGNKTNFITFFLGKIVGETGAGRTLFGFVMIL